MSRRFIAGLMCAAALLFTGVAGVALAAEPTIHDIYLATQAGNFKAAQSMMDQVLREHPNSDKAHFVQAEIFAKEGKLAQARAELERAEQLAPGLPNEKPEAVQALKKILAVGSTQVQRVVVNQVSSFPWGLVLGGLALMGFLLYFAFGRRTVAVAPMGGMGGPSAGPTFGRGFGNPVPPAGPAGGMPYQQPMGYPPVAPQGGGLGSGLIGSLATGAAVGAGVVAGEALMHRVLGDGHHDNGSSMDFIPSAHAAQPDPAWDNPPAQSYDMGGQDFGVNDASSWDSGSSDSGGGSSSDWC